MLKLIAMHAFLRIVLEGVVILFLYSVLQSLLRGTIVCNDVFMCLEDKSKYRIAYIVTKNNVKYCYLINANNNKDVFIQKTLFTESKEHIVALDSDEEFDIALLELTKIYGNQDLFLASLATYTHQ